MSGVKLLRLMLLLTPASRPAEFVSEYSDRVQEVAEEQQLQHQVAEAAEPPQQGAAAAPALPEGGGGAAPVVPEGALQAAQDAVIQQYSFDSQRIQAPKVGCLLLKRCCCLGAHKLLLLLHLLH